MVCGLWGVKTEIPVQNVTYLQCFVQKYSHFPGPESSRKTENQMKILSEMKLACAAIFVLAFTIRVGLVPLRHDCLHLLPDESLRVARSINETGVFGDPWVIPTGATGRLAPFKPYGSAECCAVPMIWESSARAVSFVEPFSVSDPLPRRYGEQSPLGRHVRP
jgi:hypothetical protein